MPNGRLQCWPMIALAATLSIGQWCLAETNGPGTEAAQPLAKLTLGGSTILTLRSTAGGMTPQERVDAIDERISELLGTPNIKPSDVVVYTPAGKSPVIYALGRRLITVDSATAKASGAGKSPIELAEDWAKSLQQVLPRVDWRPSNEPEPVVPANPPLKITSDFGLIGAKLAPVTLRSMVVFKVAALTTGGMTAEERADLLGGRLKRAAQSLQSDPGTGVTVVPVASPAISSNIPKLSASGPGNTPTPASLEIVVGTTPIINVDARQAKLSGSASPAVLAYSWAKNVRVALGMPAVPVDQSVTKLETQPPTPASTMPKAPNAPRSAAKQDTPPATPSHTLPKAPSAPQSATQTPPPLPQ